MVGMIFLVGKVLSSGFWGFVDAVGFFVVSGIDFSGDCVNGLFILWC